MMPNITIHLISYSLQLPLPGDCGRYVVSICLLLRGGLL
jgi:hypothetical protein